MTARTSLLSREARRFVSSSSAKFQKAAGRQSANVCFPPIADITSLRHVLPMCNLYGMTATVDEMRRVFGSFEGDRDNLPSFGEIYPNYKAPVLRRNGDSLKLRGAGKN